MFWISQVLQFGHLLTYKDIQVLDIADEYQYMDKELVSIIKQSVGSYLALTLA